MTFKPRHFVFNSHLDLMSSVNFRSQKKNPQIRFQVNKKKTSAQKLHYKPHSAEGHNRHNFHDSFLEIEDALPFKSFITQNKITCVIPQNDPLTISK